jgi:predicted nucleotidyltransferase
MSDRVNTLETRFTSLIQRHLSNEVLALYLRGSAARDDWVPGLSDVDFYMIVRDGIFENLSSKESFYGELNLILEEIGRRWSKENPSLRVVPLSRLSTNPIGSYLTGIDARLLLGSDVLWQVPKPSSLDISRFGSAEFNRFYSFWTREFDPDRVSDTLLEAAHQQQVVLKLAQTALLSRGVSALRKQEVADAFMREFQSFNLAHVVDQAQRFRLLWPKPRNEDLRSFVNEAKLFPQALKRHLSAT